jgi:hypothetical protein
MAFEATDLSVLAYANGFTLWHYTTADADVTAANYFNAGSHMLRAGDILIVNQNTGVSTDTTFVTVSGISSGVVTATDLLAA